MYTVPPQEQAALSLRLFGGFEIYKATIALPRTRTRSERWLLALLVLRHNREVERDWLAGTLWPDSEEEQALYNLRRSLSELRRVLGEEASRLLAPTTRTVTLDTEGAFVDVLAFDASVAKGDMASLEQAIDLYRGPLLEGCLEEWLLPERQRYEQTYLAALETLAAQAIERQNHAVAIQHLSRALSCAPLRESTLQALMRSLAESGDRSGALAAYRRFRLHLHEHLQMEPDIETTALYRRLRTEAGGRSIPAVSIPAAAISLAVQHHIPHPLTPLIGRETEIAEIVNCLDMARLVTLAGTGGVGKTRLAIAVANQAAEDYAEGTWFLDLAALTDASQVAHAAAGLLGVSVEVGRVPLDALCQALAARSLLLVLDNCEHLTQACAELTERVLSRCPGVRILAASRQPLGLRGEQVCRVQGLALPDCRRSTLPPLPTEQTAWNEFAACDAVQLFAARAAAANGAFRLTLKNMPDVTKICCLLDGIPFALELAAAWVKSLPASQIAQRLTHSFDLLIEASGTALPRQQTLRATLDWSCQLLSEAEKTLLYRLSMFSGGWTLEAAEAVCALETTGTNQTNYAHYLNHAQNAKEAKETKHAAKGITAFSPPDTLLLLTQLVAKSLVVYEEVSGEEKPRYRLLETTRQYAGEQCLPADYAEGCRRHAHFFLQLARQAQASLADLGKASVWYTRAREDQDNLRAALAWWRKEHLQEGAELLCLLIRCGLLPYHSQEAKTWVVRLQEEEELPCAPASSFVYRHVGEWADWLGDTQGALHLWEKSLQIATACADKSEMASALMNLGCHVMKEGEFEQAAEYLEASQAHFAAVGNAVQSAEARNRLALLESYRREPARAQELAARSLEEGHRRGDKSMIADALDILGVIAWQEKDYATAQSRFTHLADLLREEGSRFSANALRHLSAVEGAMGDFASAWQHQEEARTINRNIGFRAGEGWDLFYMADLASQQGDSNASWSHLAESLRIFEALGETGSVAICLWRWGQYEARAGRWERAACLWSHLEQRRTGQQAPITSLLRAEYEADLASCRACLTAETFRAAWERGQKLQDEQALEFARAAPEYTKMGAIGERTRSQTNFV